MITTFLMIFEMSNIKKELGILNEDSDEFEQTLGDGEGQGSLECCSPWGCKEWDMTKQLN